MEMFDIFFLTLFSLVNTMFVRFSHDVLIHLVYSLPRAVWPTTFAFQCKESHIGMQFSSFFYMSSLTAFGPPQQSWVTETVWHIKPRIFINYQCLLEILAHLCSIIFPSMNISQFIFLFQRLENYGSQTKSSPWPVFVYSLWANKSILYF